MKNIRSASDVKKVTDINMNYIKAFIDSASEEDMIWIEKTIANCRMEEEKNIRSNHTDLNDDEVHKRVDRQYFGAFRAAFARQYHPELYASKKPIAKKNTLQDAISKRRAVLNAAN